MPHRELQTSSVTPTEAIPPQPDVLARLLDALGRDEASVSSIEHIISSDPGVTAAVISYANSPKFYRRTPVTTVRAALQVLGLGMLTSVAMAHMVANALSAPSPALQEFWRRSTACAERCTLMALEPVLRRKGLPGAPAYVFGLLQDCGAALLMQRVEGYSALYLESIRISGDVLTANERKLNADHSRLGSELAESWHFPRELVQAIRYHHSPDHFSPDNTDLPSETLLVLAVAKLSALADIQDPAVAVTAMDRWLPRLSRVLDESEADLAKIVNAHRKT